MTAHKIHGNSFSQIAKMVPGRTDVRSIACARPGCVCACGMCALLSPACMEHFFAHAYRTTSRIAGTARSPDAGLCKLPVSVVAAVMAWRYVAQSLACAEIFNCCSVFHVRRTRS